jgi:hypothetical protein
MLLSRINQFGEYKLDFKPTLPKDFTRLDIIDSGSWPLAIPTSALIDIPLKPPPSRKMVTSGTSKPYGPLIEKFCLAMRICWYFAEEHQSFICQLPHEVGDDNHRKVLDQISKIIERLSHLDTVIFHLNRQTFQEHYWFANETCKALQNIGAARRLEQIKLERYIDAYAAYKLHSRDDLGLMWSALSFSPINLWKEEAAVASLEP